MRAIALPLALLAGLAGCASAGSAPRAVAAGQEATLTSGESVRLPDGAQLTYDGVQSDSRCPPKVTCIQAGSARMRFRYAAADGATSAVEVESPQPATAAIPPWRLTIVALDFGAPARARVRIDRAD